MALNEAQVIEKIREAFSMVVCPAPGNVGFDPTGRDLESKDVERYFSGVLWEDVDFEFLQGYDGDKSAILVFMSIDAFHYYLPAFMIISIKNYCESDCAPDTIISLLTLPDKNNILYADSLKKIEKFSPRQTRSIKEYLKYMGEVHADELLEESKRALRSYWIDLN